MTFKEYLDYIKDNPKEYWFKSKLYGWGWTPVKWQGWITIASAVVLIVLNGLSLDKTLEPSSADINWFFAKTVAIVAVLIFVCYKTGEKPGWRWGPPKKK